MGFCSAREAEMKAKGMVSLTRPHNGVERYDPIRNELSTTAASDKIYYIGKPRWPKSSPAGLTQHRIKAAVDQSA